MLLRRVFLAISLASLVLAVLCPAQDATTTISATARLVTLPVIVREKNGKLVQGLGKDDFTLTVDGQPAAIRYFDRDAEVPLTLGLLVDTSMSQRTILPEEKKASVAFLNGMLPAAATPAKPSGDRAFVLQFDRKVVLLQGLTADTQKLQDALGRLDVPHRDPNYVPPEGAGPYAWLRQLVGTKLYDAVVQSAGDEMSQPLARKAVILLTDGDDHGSVATLERSIEAAQRADVVVYGIYFKGEGLGGGGLFGGAMRRRGGGSPGDGKKALEQMTDQTGGRMFEVSKKLPIEAIYSMIGEELRSQYRLGYTPTAGAANSGFHQVVLTIPARKKLTVQTRDGFYTVK